jgi:hypothetical protein
MKVAATPSHSYTTHTANGGKPAEAETIYANGQKYIQVHGKWMRIPVTSRDVVEQEKEKEAKGKSTCQVVRRESVNGEAATLYSVHREYDEVEEDGQMWVSRGTGLLLRCRRGLRQRRQQGKGTSLNALRVRQHPPADVDAVELPCVQHLELIRSVDNAGAKHEGSFQIRIDFNRTPNCLRSIHAYLKGTVTNICPATLA